MRALLLEGELRMDLLVNAYLLNLLYLVIGFACFMVAFRSARKHGLLLQVGE
jgi:ABC-2 type transport system permease protein